jgi:site-specific recombinase XerD
MVKKTHLEPFMEYLANRQYSQLAITNYEVTARKFLEMVGKQPSEITIEDVERYVRAMNTDINEGKPYSNNAKISKFSGLKAFIEYLNLKVLKNKKIEYDKQLLHPPSATIPDKEVLTKEEIKRLFESAKDNKRDLAIIVTLYYSTQRKTSIQSLNISDINWQTGEVWIRHGTKQKKGVYEYQVSIKEAIPILKDYVDNQREEPKLGNEDALFLNGTGQRICKETINIILKRHVANSGITKRVYPHLLRATGVTIMDSSGMTRDQIIKRTGHKDIDSLKTYIRPNPTECNKKADECLSLDTTTPQKPEPQPQPEKKPETPKPTDVYISKTDVNLREMELQLQLKQAELEILRLKSQHQDISHLYG